MMERESKHYSYGRRFSFISNAWILNDSWNDKEEIAALQVDLSLRKEELRQAQAALAAKDQQVQAWQMAYEGVQRQLAEQDQELARVKEESDSWQMAFEEKRELHAELLGESVWAMETIRELIMLKLDRKNQTWAELEKECLAHPYYQHTKRFLARPDVREWQERQKETGETT